MSPELVGFLVLAHSVHSGLAALATFALTLLPAPVKVTRYYALTWFIPFVGPIWAAVFAWPYYRADNERRHAERTSRLSPAATFFGTSNSR